METHVLFVFVDGIGLGPAGDHNPFSARFVGLEQLTAGRRWLAGKPFEGQTDRVVRAIDATLGVDGLPQSGTGQAALFTGVNCPKLAGRHYGPYPHSATRPAIADMNIFARLKNRFAQDPEPGAFANAYPDRFFSYAKRRDWWTVTTRCCLDAGVRIRDASSLQRGEAISADITGRGWPQKHPSIETISEAEAARRLHGISRQHRFTLFEYYLTDKAGHSRDPERASAVIQSLSELLGELDAMLDPLRDTLVVTSDHGNLEDLSSKSHTHNPVPLIVRGVGAPHFATVDDLTGVVPAVMRALEAG